MMTVSLWGLLFCGAELCLVRCEADSAGIHLTHSSERGTFEHRSKTDKHSARLTLCEANASYQTTPVSTVRGKAEHSPREVICLLLSNPTLTMTCDELYRYIMGLINTKWNLESCDDVTASSFCRRRLPVVMVRLRMAQTVKMATQLIQQGHVRVGTEVIKDPAFLVTRNLEDFVTWVNTSAIKKHIMEYNEMRDDYDMMD
ncbi:Small subunit (SSU) processome component [Homalodisca vitripennis]|nr:Small subunit (SSU) processome component [Homalodisca vitripennis]